ncbi:hypothetical protein JZ751_028758 [Albula glossodonta]|uniref:Uncharacterized protein n=1 Tax=Albula glossodonta TaxID=121402 RepID=A0A8T2MP18_9TELE|nr:hypothetical protein JZ751_028758 [Albula glossodonta]
MQGFALMPYLKRNMKPTVAAMNVTTTKTRKRLTGTIAMAPKTSRDRTQGRQVYLGVRGQHVHRSTESTPQLQKQPGQGDHLPALHHGTETDHGRGKEREDRVTGSTICILSH